MSRSPSPLRFPGQWTVDQLRPGQPYELSRGELIECLPAGRRHGHGHRAGTLAVTSDPDVTEAGLDVGHRLDEKTLRAPDVSIGHVDNEPGFADKAPLLAIEYADRGQDEEDLQEKIHQLLEAGTRYIWVVRLVGPRRVDVYEANTEAVRTLTPDDFLEAKGILRNPVPVNALFDAEASYQVTLRNLLQRQGYDNLENVRDEGRSEGRAEGLLDLLEARGFSLDEAFRQRVRSCQEPAILKAWLQRALRIESAGELFETE